MNFISSINVSLVVFAIVAAVMIASGIKRGMMREIFSFISSGVLVFVILVIAWWIRNYLSGTAMNIIIAVLLFIFFCVIYVILKNIYYKSGFSNKKPLLPLVDKFVGGLFGLFQALLAVWLLYGLLILLELGRLEDWMRMQLQSNQILTWVYEHNYLYILLDKIVTRLS